MGEDNPDFSDLAWNILAFLRVNEEAKGSDVSEHFKGVKQRRIDEAIQELVDADVIEVMKLH